jgi:type IV secretion system protein VirB10
MVDVPQPPENPFMNENDEHEPTDATFASEEGLPESKPNVAARPERVFMVLFIVIVILLFLGYLTLSGSRREGNQEKKDDRRVASAPVEPPPLPENPIIEPPPVIAPPSIPEPTRLEIIKPEEDSAAKRQAMDRLKSKMLISDGASGFAAALGGDKKAPAPTNDPNSAFEATVIAATTKAERVEATNIGDLRHTIAQGRIIHATMESALNTDMPAPIRAIVSRDTYGESGREPLIPKGSRLIGTYNTDITGGQSRVFVVWTRVIRPDGIDIQLGSPLVDQIGMAGIGGQIDTKFQSIFSRSVLSSILTIGLAIGSDKISGGSTTTVNSGLGGSSTTGDAATTATVSALNRLGSVSDNFIQRFIDARPTILVDQGTIVNVFVNRDLVFPTDVTKSTKVIN